MQTKVSMQLELQAQAKDNRVSALTIEGAARLGADGAGFPGSSTLEWYCLNDVVMGGKSSASKLAEESTAAAHIE